MSESQNLWFRIYGLACGMYGLGFKVRHLVFRVQN